MPLSTAPFSQGQAARKAFCYCGTVGFDMEIFVTIELVLLMLYMKIYCHHLSWQGWDTARTGSVEVGMQKGTQPEEITKKEQRKRFSRTGCPNFPSAVESSVFNISTPVFVLSLRGPKAASASLGSWEPDPKHPKLSGKSFLLTLTMVLGADPW